MIGFITGGCYHVCTHTLSMQGKETLRCKVIRGFFFFSFPTNQSTNKQTNKNVTKPSTQPSAVCHWYFNLLIHFALRQSYIVFLIDSIMSFFLFVKSLFWFHKSLWKYIGCWATFVEESFMNSLLYFPCFGLHFLAETCICVFSLQGEEGRLVK